MTNHREGGRRELFETLYRKHFRRLVKFYVVVFRTSEDDACDLAQDAFMRFYEAMDEYRGDAEWAYIEAIARRVALNRIRARETAKRDVRREVSIEGLPPTVQLVAPQEAGLAEREAGEIARRQLREGISALPKAQRQCLQLWLDGFKYEQIAALMKISLDAVRSRIRDAKRALRVQFRHDPEE